MSVRLLLLSCILIVSFLCIPLVFGLALGWAFLGSVDFGFVGVFEFFDFLSFTFGITVFCLLGFCF